MSASNEQGFSGAGMGRGGANPPFYTEGMHYYLFWYFGTGLVTDIRFFLGLYYTVGHE